ncbi:hypothetical protein [Streptomyces griseus]|uniref:hypothetical protein n=1 Tax=Streptomyces griseus TaxID=1911 RepID=UPI000A3B0653|nr:hypothetical protein [Streptomyces fimicarius]
MRRPFDFDAVRPVHEELVEMHESENLPDVACQDGALRIAANHARELAALARTGAATATAEAISRFLEDHAAELDEKRRAL